MVVELEHESFGQVADQLRELAAYVEHERLIAAAQTFRAFASELEEEVLPDRLRQIAGELQEALRAGPMSISDHPITNSSGEVDPQAAARFDALIEQLRKFARQTSRRPSMFGLLGKRKR